jgi:hypothetical protein
MLNTFEIALLIWILLAVSVWLIIRKLKPEWIGLSKDLNKQIIDGVKFETCPKCKNGLLEPQLNRKIKIHGIPVFYMYIKNQNIDLHCNQCTHKETIFVKHYRFSLTQKL